MRTITVKKTTGGKFSPGWKEVEITKAAYGDYNGTKYIDCFFKDYPDSLNLRIYEKKGKDGEEFAIGRLFRFANAGITEVLSGSNGENVVKIDDSPSSLMGKMVNVYFYKDGKYSRILKQFAPISFENAAESFTDKDVEYWQTKAEKYFNDFVKPKLNKDEGSNTEFVSSATTNETSTISDTDAIPF